MQIMVWYVPYQISRHDFKYNGYHQMNRWQLIAIIGRPGSGKSTFSLNLSIATGIPTFHVDKIFFQSGWKEREAEHFHRDLNNWISQPQWIIDGNALGSLRIRYAAADTVIVFALPAWRCIYRIILRRFMPKNTQLDDRAPNCPERITWKLIWYTITYRRRLWKVLTPLMTEFPRQRRVFITSDNTAKALL